MKNIKWSIYSIMEPYRGGSFYRKIYALVYPIYGLTIERSIWIQNEIYGDFNLLIIRHGKY